MRRYATAPPVYQLPEHGLVSQVGVVVGATVSETTEKPAAAESRPAPFCVVTCWLPAPVAVASKL